MFLSGSHVVGVLHGVDRWGPWKQVVSLGFSLSFHARMKVPWREAEPRFLGLYHPVGLGDTGWESFHSGFTELREKLNRRVMLLCGECCA